MNSNIPIYSNLNQNFSNKNIMNENFEEPFYQKWWFYLILLIGFLLIIAIIYYFNFYKKTSTSEKKPPSTTPPSTTPPSTTPPSTTPPSTTPPSTTPPSTTTTTDSTSLYSTESDNIKYLIKSLNEDIEIITMRSPDEKTILKMNNDDGNLLIKKNDSIIWNCAEVYDYYSEKENKGWAKCLTDLEKQNLVLVDDIKEKEKENEQKEKDIFLYKKILEPLYIQQTEKEKEKEKQLESNIDLSHAEKNAILSSDIIKNIQDRLETINQEGVVLEKPPSPQDITKQAELEAQKVTEELLKNNPELEKIINKPMNEPIYDPNAPLTGSNAQELPENQTNLGLYTILPANLERYYEELQKENVTQTGVGPVESKTTQTTIDTNEGSVQIDIPDLSNLNLNIPDLSNVNLPQNNTPSTPIKIDIPDISNLNLQNFNNQYFDNQYLNLPNFNYSNLSSVDYSPFSYIPGNYIKTKFTDINENNFDYKTTDTNKICSYKLIFKPNGNLIIINDNKKNRYNNEIVWSAIDNLQIIKNEGGPYKLGLFNDGTLRCFDKNNNNYWIIFPQFKLENKKIKSIIKDNFCLDIKNNSSKSGELVNMFNCFNNPTQYFSYIRSNTIEKDKKLLNYKSNKCLQTNVDKTLYEVKDYVSIDDCDYSVFDTVQKQRWKYDINSGRIINEVGANKQICLEVRNNQKSNGAIVITNDCNNNLNQKWFVDY
jgi:hypothetical protein